MQKPNCIHHYIYESPNGSPIIQGICKHCGAIQTGIASYDAAFNNRRIKYGRQTDSTLMDEELERDHAL
jgi:hypothetical protein